MGSGSLLGACRQSYSRLEAVSEYGWCSGCHGQGVRQGLELAWRLSVALLSVLCGGRSPHWSLKRPAGFDCCRPGECFAPPDPDVRGRLAALRRSARASAEKALRVQQLALTAKEE